MLLAIDIGNSNIGLAIARDGGLVATRRARTDRGATSDELELLFDGLLALDGYALAPSLPEPAGPASATGSIGAIALASTVPSLTTAVEDLAARRGVRCVTASAGTLPMAVRVDHPAEVGPDRLVNAYAAAHLHGTPAVVVDCGTATTFDAVDRDGAFVGGAIAPGLELGLDALAARTAALPRVELRTEDRSIGLDTAAAIRAGTVLGHRAMIEGLLGRIRRDLARSAGVGPHEIRAILTGGLSNQPWARSVEGIDAIDPLLTLRGLALFHRAVAGPEAER